MSLNNTNLNKLYNLNINTITELNNYLVINNINPFILDYVKLLRNKFSPEIDIRILDELNQYVDKKNEYCINANYYYKYKDNIINFDIDNYNSHSGTILKTLKRSGLILNKDFECNELEITRVNRGTTIMNVYMLKPKAFKKLLVDINDHQTRIKFIDYYQFLEDCLLEYEQYQKIKNEYIINKQKELLSNKDDKIDHLIKQNDHLIKQNDHVLKNNEEQKQQIAQLLNYGKDTKEALENTQEVLEDIKEQNDNLEERNGLLLEQTEVVIQQNEVISDKLNIAKEDRVPKTDNPRLLPKASLYVYPDSYTNNGNIMMQFTRVQLVGYDSAMLKIKSRVVSINEGETPRQYRARLRNDNTNVAHVINYSPNSINLINRIRQFMDKIFEKEYDDYHFSIAKLVITDKVQFLNKLNTNTNYELLTKIRNEMTDEKTIINYIIEIMKYCNNDKNNI